MGIKGYKVFNADWTCRGFKYEVGKTYKHDGPIEVCKTGFHFCRKCSDCFNYYKFNKNNHVAEVEAIGLVRTINDKSVTDEIVIVRELTWEEVLRTANEGTECTGYGNTGNYNTGNYNTGNYNTGNYNANNYNTGNRNTGNYNTGSWNAGAFNTGDFNTGDYNTGNHNTGDWNSIGFSSGFFNSIYTPIIAFNKPLSITRVDFMRCEGFRLLNIKYDEARKCCSDPDNFKAVCKLMWGIMLDRERQEVQKIPNFDPDVFKEITGIDVNND